MRSHLGEDPQTVWKAQAVQQGAGVLSSLSHALFGTTPTPVPTQTTTAVPVVAASSWVPPAIAKDPGKGLLVAGFVAAGIFGVMYLRKQGGSGRGRARSRSRRRSYSRRRRW